MTLEEFVTAAEERGLEAKPLFWTGGNFLPNDDLPLADCNAVQVSNGAGRSETVTRAIIELGPGTGYGKNAPLLIDLILDRLA